MRYIALWLSLVCVIVFMMQLFFGTDALVLDKTLMWSEPWTIITSIFAHANAYHLLSNLFALSLFGLVLEGRIGPNRVLALFLVSGVIVNLFTPYPRSLGASGAIYSLIGCLAVLRPMMVIWIDMIPMPMILAGVVYLIQDTIRSFIPSDVANLAHISGLFIGVAAGLVWRKQFADKPKSRNKPGHNPALEREIDKWEEEYMPRR